MTDSSCTRQSARSSIFIVSEIRSPYGFSATALALHAFVPLSYQQQPLKVLKSLVFETANLR